MLVGVVGFLGSEVVLSPVVSHCLRLSPFMWGVGVGWCGRLLGLWSGLVSRCLPLSPLSPFMWGRVLVDVVASWALKWSCLPLSPIVSGCLHSCGGWVLVGVAAILSSEVVLSPVVSGCLPSCGGWVLVGVVGFLGSEVVLSPVLSPVVSGCPLHVGGGCWLVWPHLEQKHSRDQNHRLQSKFAYCKLFGVYAGVIFSAHMGVFQIGVPQNGWFIMENRIKMDDLGYPYFGNTHILELSKTHGPPLLGLFNNETSERSAAPWIVPIWSFWWSHDPAWSRWGLPGWRFRIWMFPKMAGFPNNHGFSY